MLLGRQQQKLEDEVARLDGQEQRLAVIADRVQACQAAPAATPLGELCSAFADLLASSPEEYVLYGISAAALAQVCTLAAILHLESGWHSTLRTSWYCMQRTMHVSCCKVYVCARAAMEVPGSPVQSSFLCRIRSGTAVTQQ